MSTPRTALLVSLTLLVGAAHWWLLRDFGSADAPSPAPATNAPVFETRSIAPPPPPPPAPAVAVAPPKPKPQLAPPPPAPALAPAPTPSPHALEPTVETTVSADQATLPSDVAVPDSNATPSSADDALPPDSENTADDVVQAAATNIESTASAEETAESEASETTADSAQASAAPAGIRLRSAPGEAEQSDLPYQPPPAQLLQFKVQGQAKGFEYGASAQLNWQPQNDSYQASQEVSAFLLGKRAQSSRGRITEGGLQPERFEDRARKKLRAATLDWASGMARFEPEAPTVPIAAGTQDRLSVFLQLAGMVAAAPQRYPTGATISVPTASTRGLQTWVFQVHDTPRLDLPAGVLETVRLERLPQGGRDQKAELWLAPALGYLPVRIRLNESNGDYADLRLQSHSAP